MPRFHIKKDGEPDEPQKQEESKAKAATAAADDLTARDTVLVCVRARPLNRKERKAGQGLAWKIDGNNISQQDMTKSQGKRPERYTFEQVWDENITNADIFNRIGYSLVKATMDGYNGVVLAYGQTSAGKTFTVHGGEDDPGLIPRSVEAIFEYIENTPDRDFVIRVAYLEIYNEIINDLVDPARANLKIKEDPKAGVYVEGLSESHVVSTEQVYALLASGESHRHIGRTDYNAVSSRSHTIFQILVQSQSAESQSKTVLDSKLSLVDLAGSENLKTAQDPRAKETGPINKSLVTFSNVISKLSEAKGPAPFKDSKLTNVLRPFLSGKSCVSIICAISPSITATEDSSATLKFANRAKEIKNSPAISESEAGSAALIFKYKQEIEALKNVLAKEEDGPAPAPSVDPAELQRLREKVEQEKAEIQNRIENLQKLFVRSSIPTGDDQRGAAALVDTLAVPGGAVGAGGAGGPVRRPSYLAMFGAGTAAPATAHGRPSLAPTAGGKLAVPSGSAAGLARLRQGSVGLNQETGNAANDELLCLPTTSTKTFISAKEREKIEALKDKSAQQQEELRILKLRMEEMQQSRKTKDAAIEALRERLQDIRSQTRDKDMNIASLTEHLQDLEDLMEDDDDDPDVTAAAAVAAAHAQPASAKDAKGAKGPTGATDGGAQDQPRGPAVLELTLGCRGLVPKRKTINPLMGFFVRNETTGLFEYEGRTEQAKADANPTFLKKFTVANNPATMVRVSVYDVDDENSIQATDFIGSVCVSLKDVVDKAWLKSGLAFFPLETEDKSGKASVQISLGKEFKDLANKSKAAEAKARAKAKSKGKDKKHA